MQSIGVDYMLFISITVFLCTITFSGTFWPLVIIGVLGSLPFFFTGDMHHTLRNPILRWRSYLSTVLAILALFLRWHCDRQHYTASTHEWHHLGWHLTVALSCQLFILDIPQHVINLAEIRRADANGTGDDSSHNNTLISISPAQPPAPALGRAEQELTAMTRKWNTNNGTRYQSIQPTPPADKRPISPPASPGLPPTHEYEYKLRDVLTSAEFVPSGNPVERRRSSVSSSSSFSIAGDDDNPL